ncbi:FAD-binding oxidoreductase [Actinoplanes sp. LDG1-06]|uniref:FAD-binding oxidoreductase n=1 Tax=Paractinoplanes ovalisporus TaxID=2810368 RepID=A0ABS2A3J1_9ACTN|nr:FAD-binding oxidoreductase [Actinoplanes ovalisporus]MBM2614416.1 FAD-binding oxidoreductase [Actinoplanes ovalisporus]
MSTEQKVREAETAPGPVVLTDEDGGLDPWTAAVWLAARNDNLRITLPGAPAAVSSDMADKAMDTLTALAGPRVSTGDNPSRFDDLPASLVKFEPGDPGYRGRSSTYMRGGRPALILRPRTPDEVAEALAFARRHPELQLGLRSGGHGISGRSTNNGGLIIDVGAMNDIEMLGNGLVRVGPGATWKQVAAFLDKYDLALGSGDYGGVGVGGLATAGGIGFLSREQGLTIDRLRAVELVLADGTQVRASAEENQDLFWAVRGAGANFGVATAFEFEAEEVTEVGWAQFVLVSHDVAESLKAYGDVAREAPRDTTVFWLTGPPRQGQSVIQMYGMVDSGDADTIIERLTPFATTALLAQQQVVVARYADVMAQAGDVGPEGHHGRGEPVARSGFLPELTDAFARDVAELLRSGQVFFFQLRHMGGAIADVPAHATALAHRTPEFSVTAIGADRRGMDEVWDRLMAKHFDGLYLSFETDQRPERLHDAFPAATLARLRELKRRYDPTTLFRDNFAIVEES